jgi:probable phosphoglycerate mutase
LILYLLRHGESEGNAKRVFAVRSFDPPLTQLGEEQARRQAEALSSAGIAEIYASPLLRTRQTAAFTAERCGLSVACRNALWEVDVGHLDGRDVTEETIGVFRAVLEAWEAGQWDACLEGGETFAAVRDRFHSFLTEVSEGYDGPVLIVGHGVLFMIVLWAFCDRPQPHIFDNYMGRGHLSVLTGQDGRFTLRAFDLAPGTGLDGLVLDEEGE